MREIFAKLKQLTTRKNTTYNPPDGIQFRKSVVWLMAYVQRPMYDITIDIIKLSFAVSMVYLIVASIIRIVSNIWR